jgi:hypothetical protein
MSTEPKKRSSPRKSQAGQGRKDSKTNAELRATLIAQIAVVLVAVIGCFSTVIVSLLNSPVASNLFPAKSTPTFTQVMLSDTPTLVGILISDTPTNTELPPVTFTDTPPAVDTPLPSASSDSALLQQPTEEALGSKMIVVLTSSLDEGKSPLPVNFIAKNSYVLFADGSVASCSTANFCTFTWAVYRDLKQVVAPFKGKSSFSYTLSGKGQYSVTVYVCRGTVCEDDGVVVIVK